MRRSFAKLHHSLKPDAVLFLGDLNDGGRDTVDESVRVQNRGRFMERVFQSEYTAWNKDPVVVDAPNIDIQQSKEEDEGLLDNSQEPTNNNKVSSQESVSRPTYLVNKDIPSTAQEREAVRQAGKSVRLYVAGNHDVGYGNDLIHKMALRFKQDYGALNYEIQLGNHAVVVLDTLSLSAEDPAIRNEAQMFLDQIGQGKKRMACIACIFSFAFRVRRRVMGRLWVAADRRGAEGVVAVIFVLLVHSRLTTLCGIT